MRLYDAIVLCGFWQIPRTAAVDKTGATNGSKAILPQRSHDRDLLSTPSPDISSSEDSEAVNLTNVRDGGKRLLADLDCSLTEAVEEDFEEKDVDESNLLKRQKVMSDTSTIADDDEDEEDDSENDDDEEDNEDDDACTNKVRIRITFLFVFSCLNPFRELWIVHMF